MSVSRGRSRQGRGEGMDLGGEDGVSGMAGGLERSGREGIWFVGFEIARHVRYHTRRYFLFYLLVTERHAEEHYRVTSRVKGGKDFLE